MNITELVDQITPLIAQKLMARPTVFGQAKRVKLSPTVCANNTLFNVSSGEITIEDDVCFGHNVCLLTGTHDVQKKGRERIESYPSSGHDIVISQGVWLSSNVTVLGPSVIGENAVIAAGSLVIGDVKANCIYAGSPAKFIKEIDFDEQ